MRHEGSTVQDGGGVTKGRRKDAQGTADLSHGREGPRVTWAHQMLVYAQPRLHWLDWVILFLSPSSTVNLRNDTQNFPIIFIAFLTLKKLNLYLDLYVKMCKKDLMGKRIKTICLFIFLCVHDLHFKIQDENSIYFIFKRAYEH